MARMIFVNLPVKDLAASTSFFASLGYEKNPQFSNDSGSAVVISETIMAMLLTEPFFQSFTKKGIADASTSTEVMLALSADSREEVDELVEKAFAAGGTVAGDTQDHGFMYGRSFYDLDSHHWEVFWMDPASIEG